MVAEPAADRFQDHGRGIAFQAAVAACFFADRSEQTDRAVVVGEGAEHHPATCMRWWARSRSEATSEAPSTGAGVTQGWRVGVSRTVTTLARSTTVIVRAVLTS
ncbi:hypothetical protein [Streptomyces tauricus]|uniref:hypothetical protein n=1 Tax=Streptomyces tauricus TaxID=68274 RepID=UPI002243444F|nr:hypothetical protein [Streptomyces tauricus]MCW8101753.1 hypothetical protein [Streptomyces tauricus]